MPREVGISQKKTRCKTADGKEPGTVPKAQLRTGPHLFLVVQKIPKELFGVLLGHGTCPLLPCFPFLKPGIFRRHLRRLEQLRIILPPHVWRSLRHDDRVTSAQSTIERIPGEPPLLTVLCCDDRTVCPDDKDTLLIC